MVLSLSDCEYDAAGAHNLYLCQQCYKFRSAMPTVLPDSTLQRKDPVRENTIGTLVNKEENIPEKNTFLLFA
jgi:hypothetical protein